MNNDPARVLVGCTLSLFLLSLTVATVLFTAALIFGWF